MLLHPVWAKNVPGTPPVGRRLSGVEINAIHEAGHAVSAWIHGEDAVFVELMPAASDGECGGRLRTRGTISIVTALSGLAAQSRAITEEQGDGARDWTFNRWATAVALAAESYSNLPDHDIQALHRMDGAEQLLSYLAATHHLMSQPDSWRAAHMIKARLLNEALLPWIEVCVMMAASFTVQRRQALREAVGTMLPSASPG